MFLYTSKFSLLCGPTWTVAFIVADMNSPQINTLVFNASIPITGASPASCNFFLKFLNTFSRYRWSEICTLWNSTFYLPNWISSPRSSFLEGSSLRPSLLVLEAECHLVASLELGLGWCFASVSCRWMKHNSDPILDSPGYSDHSNLAEDFSSHSGLSLTPNSLVSVSPLPNLLQKYFPDPLGDDTLLPVWRKMAAGKHRRIHDIQQTKEMVPLITCEAFFG